MATGEEVASIAAPASNLPAEVEAGGRQATRVAIGSVAAAADTPGVVVIAVDVVHQCSPNRHIPAVGPDAVVAGDIEVAVEVVVPASKEENLEAALWAPSIRLVGVGAAVTHPEPYRGRGEVAVAVCCPPAGSLCFAGLVSPSVVTPLLCPE